MSTLKRRLIVTLEPEVDVVLRRLARARRRPQAAIVRELLDAARPGLEQAADLLEQAERVDPRLVLASMAAQAHGDIARATQGALVLPVSKVKRERRAVRPARKKRRKPPG